MKADCVASLTARLARCHPQGWDKAPNPGQVAAAAISLLSAAGRYQRLAEHACNRELTQGEQRRQGVLEAHIRSTLQPYGCGVTFSRDPRGFVVKVQFPDGTSNTWGNDGWGIA